jgi:menaquinone-9 beta-reductase
MADTKTIDCNVAIIGAGPAGTACAAHLGQLGVRDVVLLDRHDFPRDKTCGSGLSPKGIEVLRELGVWNEVEPESYKITGIRIVTPGGIDSWQSAGTGLEAVVCQRRILDHILLKKALGRGIRFVPHFNATELLTDGGRTIGVAGADGTRVRAKTTIVAGGTHCKLDGVQRERRIYQGIMGWWDDVDFRPGHLEMVFDRMLGVGYGWLFPESDKRVNIGIVYEDETSDGKAVEKGGKANGAKKENARELFQRFLDKHYGDRVSKAKPVGGWKGHPVAWSYDIEKLTAPGRLTIGESALLTHPATAEGIYQGMRSGMIAAEAVADNRRGVFREEEAWRAYEKNVRKEFSASFKYGGKIFRQMVRGRGLDVMVKTTSHPLIQSATAKLMAGF